MLIKRVNDSEMAQQLEQFRARIDNLELENVQLKKAFEHKAGRQSMLQRKPMDDVIKQTLEGEPPDSSLMEIDQLEGEDQQENRRESHNHPKMGRPSGVGRRKTRDPHLYPLRAGGIS